MVYLWYLKHSNWSKNECVIPLKRFQNQPVKYYYTSFKMRKQTGQLCNHKRCPMCLLTKLVILNNLTGEKSRLKPAYLN